jgi:hypothetical protein
MTSYCWLWLWQTTRPLVREGAPHGQDSNYQIGTNIWSWAPVEARHQDRQTDWLTDRPSVAMWLWLWLLTTSLVSWKLACEENGHQPGARLIVKGWQLSRALQGRLRLQGAIVKLTVDTSSVEGYSREAEESSLLEAVARGWLLKTASWRKGLAAVVLICELWRLAVAL